MSKKFLSVLLVLTLLISLFAGCGNTTTNDRTPTEAPKQNSEVKESETAPSIDWASLRGKVNPTDEEIAAVNHSLEDSYLGDPDYMDAQIPADYSAYPYKEEVTLDIWMPEGSTMHNYYQDVNDHPVFKLMEELTGININIIMPVAGEASTDFSLMLADGKLPDIIMSPGYYPGGVTAGIADGAYLNLTDYVGEYMPNYSAWIASNDTRSKVVKDDNGDFNDIKCVCGYEEWAYFGMMIKQKALDDTGLPVPETIDELHDFLVACKEVGYDQPLVWPFTHGTVWTGGIQSAYGVANGMLLDESGKVFYGPNADGNKEACATFAQWYAEGLINTDWATTDWQQFMSICCSDDCAVTFESPDTMYDYWTVRNGIDFVGALNVTLNKGDTPLLNEGAFYLGGTNAAITTQCENVEAALAFLDFGFTKKGWEMINYGLYGETHLIDENGLPYYHDESIIFNDPDGHTINDGIWKHRIHVWANLRDEHYANPLLAGGSSYSGAIRKYWTEEMSNEIRYPYNVVTFTPEEAEIVSAVEAEIWLLWTEYLVAIQNGQRPIDDFDEYQQLVWDAGLQDLIDCYQAAMDRYNAR